MRSDIGERYLGKTYEFDENPLGIERLCVTRNGKDGALSFHARGEDKRIDFAFGAYKLGEFPETGYTGERLGVPLGRPYPAMAAGVWSEPDKLVLRIYTIGDHLGNLTITLKLSEDSMTVLMRQTSLNFFDKYQGVAFGRSSASKQ